MHHQCVAPLAANSPHSALSRAISIASSKVRLCRDRSSSEWPSRRSWVVQLAFSNHSGELQSEFSWRRLTHPFWSGVQTAWVFFSVVRGWRLFSRTWNQRTCPWTKQSTWLRIIHSGDWCLRLALRTHSGACQKRTNEGRTPRLTSSPETERAY